MWLCLLTKEKKRRWFPCRTCLDVGVLLFRFFIYGKTLFAICLTDKLLSFKTSFELFCPLSL